MPAGSVRVPIRTEGLTAIFSGCEPVADFNTGELRTDRATGKPIYRVHVMVVLPGEVRPQVWSVSVAGEPKGIQPGEAVRFSDDLVASEWEIEGRHGIGFRASAIFSANGAARSGANKAEPS